MGFSESAEHVALTAPFWSGGIRFAGVDIPDNPANPSLSVLNDDDFVLLAVSELPLPREASAETFSGLDLAALHPTAEIGISSMLVPLEAQLAFTGLDLDAWSPVHSDGDWMI
jgi:hypothetical protein